MLSHDLAKALLKLRNNDVRIYVRHDVKGKEPAWYPIPLADSPDEEVCTPEPYIVSYDPMQDAVVIYAGTVMSGYTDEDFQ